MTLDALKQSLLAHGFRPSLNGWMKNKGKRELSHLEAAVEIDKHDTSLLKSLVVLHGQMLAEKENERGGNEECALFREHYNNFCSKRTNKIDENIWGEIYQGSYGTNGISFFLKKISDNNEYEEISRDENDIKNMFATTEIMVKGRRFVRSDYFSKILDLLAKRFPEIDESSTHYSVFTDENIPLSPVFLRSFFTLHKKKSGDDVVGYRLQFDHRLTLSDYFKASKDYMLGRKIDVGSISSISNTKDKPSFKYIDLDQYSIPGEYPYWQSFMDKFSVKSAKKVFMAWVWSVFDERNYGAQAMWIHGHGGDGKSSVIQVLADILKGAVGATDDAQMSSGFPLETLIGKRLVIHADVKNISIVHTEDFHRTTTGDPAAINRKHKTPFTEMLYMKWIFCSNHKPNLNTDERNQMRRLIYIYMPRSLNKNDYQMNREDYKKHLKSEFNFFMHDCKKAYEELCENHGEIRLCEDMQNDLRTLNDALNESIKEILEEDFIYQHLIDSSEAYNSVSYTAVLDRIVDRIGDLYTAKDVRYRLPDILTNMYAPFDKAYRIICPNGDRPRRLVFKDGDNLYCLRKNKNY